MTEEQKARRYKKSREWLCANPGKAREYEKRKRAKHGDKIKKYQDTYREVHAEEIRAKQRARWAAMSPEEKAEYYARRKAANERTGNASKSKRRHYEKNKTAINQKTKEWRVKNLDYVKTFRREKNLARYGLTTESKMEMLASQGGGCAICHRTNPGGRGYWHVDHDHEIGQGAVRGILCNNCNTTLGKIGDRLVTVREWAASAVRYMERAASRSISDVFKESA